MLHPSVPASTSPTSGFQVDPTVLPATASASGSGSGSAVSSSLLTTPSLSPTSPAPPPLFKPVYHDFIARMHARHQSWATAGAGVGVGVSAAGARSHSPESDGSDGSSPHGGFGSFSDNTAVAVAGLGLTGPSMGSSSAAGIGAGPGAGAGMQSRPVASAASGSGSHAHALASGSGSGLPLPPPAKQRRKKDADGKRRKVAKACLVCQKSHLTCDEQRPCARCVKKGIADQCIEGVRKKAKYLMEGEGEPLDHPLPQASISPTALPPIPAPLQSQLPPLPLVPAAAQAHPSQSMRSESIAESSYSLHTLAPAHPPVQQMQQGLPQMGMEEDIWLAPQMLGGSRGDSPGGGDKLWSDTNLFSNGSFDFGTSASNEYQMLDAMLNSMSPVFPFDMSGDPLSMDPLQQQQQQQQQAMHNPYLADPHSLAGISPFNTRPSVSPAHSQTLAPPLAPVQPTLISPNWPISGRPNPIDTAIAQQQQQQAGIPWSDWTDSKDQHVRGSIASAVGQDGPMASVGGSDPVKQEAEGTVWGGNGAVSKLGRARTGAEVYHGVVKPFDYTEGYHRLMEHISKNFEQREVLRVVKALAAFRPSLIALQMPMSEEDEVFLERSFQRTLIELEKLISYSATPTAVWRRTGDVVYANPEFCSLIGKQQDELLNGRPYIYQLFAKHTAISYWENFSVHAFENTTQNFFQAATLEVADKQLACSCCFTIRRDVFDLPSVIIGQFLPIPVDL